MKGSQPHRDVSLSVDLLAITNATWQREKAAGADSSDLRSNWLPTLDNLRNFFLTPTRGGSKVRRLITQMFFPNEPLNEQDHFLQFVKGPYTEWN